MTKRPKGLLPGILAASLVILVGGILLLRKYNNNKTLLERPDTIKESVTNEDGDLKLPSDFPVYPEIEIESSYSTEGDKKATSVVWKTDANVSEVSAFYKKELENGDWTITSNIENVNSSTFSFEKDNKFGFVGIGKGEGGVTIISVTIGLRD